MNIQRFFLIGSVLLLFLVPFSFLSPVSATSSNSTFQKTGGAGIGLVHPTITSENCTDCFAGYADGGSSGAIKSISTMLVVPKVSCSSKTTGYSAWGVWVDGTNSDDFAGASITSSCISGKVNYYAAWFDANIYTVCTLCQINATWTPKAGDSVFISVSYALTTEKFKFTLNDLTQHKDYTKHNAIHSSLDFGVCGSDMFLNSSSQPQPSVKFDKVKFTKCLVDGVGIGTDPNGTSTYEYFCVNSTGSAYLAKPTTLLSNENFKVKFVAQGP